MSCNTTLIMSCRYQRIKTISNQTMAHVYPNVCECFSKHMQSLLQLS